MKAMILAAGFGARMQPLTLSTPKPLIAVRGRALIDYHIQALRKINVTDIVINVHYLAEHIIAYVQQQSYLDVKLHFSHEPEILGTGGGVFQALSVLGDAPFIVLSADVFTDYPLQQLPQQLTGLAHLVMVDNPVFHPTGDFCLTPEGLLSMDKGLALTYGNIGVFHPELFARVGRKKFEMREVLVPAIGQGEITGEHYVGMWENIGTLAQLERLNRITVV